MKPIEIQALHPSGFTVILALEKGDNLHEQCSLLVKRGYRPAVSGDTWQRTPEGTPICPKHGEVMTKREKQGDTWYSHRVTDAEGEVHYCRGYPTKNGNGWQVTLPNPPRQQPPPPVAHQKMSPKPKAQPTYAPPPDPLHDVGQQLYG